MSEPKGKRWCAGQSWDRAGCGSWYPCSKGGTLEYDGKWWCKTHHPPSVAARDKALRDKWKSEWYAKEQQEIARRSAEALRDHKAACFDDLVAALEAFQNRMDTFGSWEDGCFYYNGRSASELQQPIEQARAVLKKARGEAESVFRSHARLDGWAAGEM